MTKKPNWLCLRLYGRSNCFTVISVRNQVVYNTVLRTLGKLFIIDRAVLGSIDDQTESHTPLNDVSQWGFLILPVRVLQKIVETETLNLFPMVHDYPKS